jgi:hypothetical protein
MSPATDLQGWNPPEPARAASPHERRMSKPTHRPQAVPNLSRIDASLSGVTDTDRIVSSSCP